MPAPASSRSIRRAAWAGAATFVAAIALMSASRLPARELPNGVDSPILALELMRDRSELPQIVSAGGSDTASNPRDERPVLRRSVRIDYAFIMAYTSFFSLLGLALMTRRTRLLRRLGILAIVSALGAGVLDVLENRALMSLLDGVPALLPRVFAVPKWTFVFVALGAAAPLTIDRDAASLRRWVGYAACAVSLFAAAEGIYALVAGYDPLLETANGRMVIALLLTEFFLATDGLLRHGVQAALDRMASSGVGRRIATWPDLDMRETVGEPIVDPDTLT